MLTEDVGCALSTLRQVLVGSRAVVFSFPRHTCENRLVAGPGPLPLVHDGLSAHAGCAVESHAGPRGDADVAAHRSCVAIVKHKDIICPSRAARQHWFITCNNSGMKSIILYDT